MHCISMNPLLDFRNLSFAQIQYSKGQKAMPQQTLNHALTSLVVSTSFLCILLCRIIIAVPCNVWKM